MSMEDWKNIGIGIGTVLGGLSIAISQIVIAYKKIKEKIYSKNYGVAIQRESKYTMQVYQQLEELRTNLNATRVQILEFHNGTEFATRKGYKIDCTHEVKNYEAESTKQILTNYPTTMLPIFMHKMFEDKEYFVSNVEDLINTDIATYAMKKVMDIGAFYDVLLYKQDKPIAILAVQYRQPTVLGSSGLAEIKAKQIIIESLM